MDGDELTGGQSKDLAEHQEALNRLGVKSGRDLPRVVCRINGEMQLAYDVMHRKRKMGPKAIKQARKEVWIALEKYFNDKRSQKVATEGTWTR